MQLPAIILGLVSLMSFLSGISVLIGAFKNNRTSAFWFFASMIFTAIWAASTGVFITINPGVDSKLLDIIVKTIYVSTIFSLVALLGYVAWEHRNGKILTSTFSIIGLLLSVAIILNHKFLYTDIVLTDSSNSIIINSNIFYFTYIIFICCIILATVITSIKKILKSTQKNTKRINIALLVGFSISSAIVVFNLFLPLLSYDSIWLGPISMIFSILSVYHIVLKYQALTLPARWLKFFSYSIIYILAIILYMLIFYIAFTAIFKGSTPSADAIILNFIMIILFLILMPALDGVIKIVRLSICDQSDERKEQNNDK